jgi:Tesmin/TSO1-like CXC domain, cysteine-rich domain
MAESSFPAGCTHGEATLNDLVFKTPSNENQPPIPNDELLVEVTGSRHRAEGIHGSGNLIVKAEPQSTGSIHTNAIDDAPTGLTASKLVRNASNSIDELRAPLKKRTPVGMRIWDTVTQTSNHHTTPLFRDATPRSSLTSHPPYECLPPLLRLTSSNGLRLMTEPLLETPVSATPRLWPQISGSSFGSYRVFSSNMGGGIPNATPNESFSAVRAIATHAGADIAGLNDREHVVKNESVAPAVPSRPLGDITPFSQGSIPRPEAPTRGGSIKSESDFLASMPGIISSLGPALGIDRSDFDSLPPNRWGSREYDLFRNVPMSDRPCKCTNTHCLKLYCECFQSGLFCDPRLCRCKLCHNNEENNQPRGDRMIAIKKILARRPDAFGMKPKRRTGIGCACKKSGYVSFRNSGKRNRFPIMVDSHKCENKYCSCLKKYCDCVALGKLCDSQCKCTDCKNFAQTATVKSEYMH